MLKVIESPFRKRFCFLMTNMFLVFSLAICSCSVNYIMNKNKAIYSKTLNDDNSGIIIGRVTLQSFYFSSGSNSRGIGFRDCETNKKTVYVSGHYFFLRLPVGCFEFDGIGTGDGAFEPVDEPFKFHVTKGKIKYIGSFVADEDLAIHLNTIKTKRQLRDTDIIASKAYGIKPRSSPIKFYIIDERKKVISEFLTKFPEYNQKEIHIDFMI